MAIVAILIGSVLGLMAGIVGMLFFGMPFMTAFILYLACGVGMGVLTTGYTVLLCALSSRERMSAA